MITVKQLLYHLDEWNERLNRKIIKLNWYASLYRLLYYFDQLSVVIATACLTPISSYIMTHSTQKNDLLYQIASIILISIQVILAITFIINKLIKPDKNAIACLMSARKYEELSRELEVEIDVFHNKINDPILNMEYFTRLRYYSAREQIILDWEPKIFFHKFIGKKNKVNSFGNIIMNDLTSEDSIILNMLDKLDLEDVDLSSISQ